ncbi:MAG: T9SS type A sorting domain-containing protein, partial [Salinivirgaceae bacterium]|nr:T9SS type A sorting domain-containing protein [Salinivirgaceae bacterium]
LPLDVAVIQILNTEDSIGVVYDLQTRYELLSDLLLSELDDLNMGEAWYVKHSYKMLKVALGQFKKQNHSDQISQRVIAKMIKTIKKLEKDLQKSENKSKGDSEISPELFAFIINEADAVWYGGNYDEAIELLTDKQDVATAEQLCEIEKMICRINLDRDFIASNNTLDIDEALEACEICNTVESDKSNTGGKGTTSISNNLIDGIELSIVPNPVTNGSKIRINGAEIGSELYVYSSVGSIVFNETIASENYTKLVSNSELTEGIYLISIQTNGKVAAMQKMVVVK